MGNCCRPHPPDLRATLTSRMFFISTCCVRDDTDINVCVHCSHKRMLKELKRNPPKLKKTIKTRLTI